MIHSVAPSSRERLLETARELFHLQGYNGTSMSQILQRTGVSSSSLYHFFPSKEELLMAVIDRYKELLWPQIMGPASEKSSQPIGKLLGVLDVYREFTLATNFQLGCPVGSLALEVGQSIPDARKRIAAIFKAWRAVIEGWLQEAAPQMPRQERGQIASLLLTLVEGAIVQARVLQRSEPFEIARAQFHNHLQECLKSY